MDNPVLGRPADDHVDLLTAVLLLEQSLFENGKHYVIVTAKVVVYILTDFRSEA